VLSPRSAALAKRVAVRRFAIASGGRTTIEMAASVKPKAVASGAW
jgi:hypothetical protein